MHLEPSIQPHPGTQGYKDKWIPNMDKAIISLVTLVPCISSWMLLTSSNLNFNSEVSQG